MARRRQRHETFSVCLASLESPSEPERSLQVPREFLLRVALDDGRRKLPHPREQRAAAPVGIGFRRSNQQSPLPGVQKDCRGERELDLWALPACGGQRLGKAQLVSAAPTRHRAFDAARRPRGAYTGAQLHHRLVAVARRVRRDQLLRGALQLHPPPRRTQVAAHGEQSRQHARHITVQRGVGFAIGDAEDRRGGVAADPGEAERSFEFAREAAAVARNDFFGRAMQVARPAVIAESRPEFEHFLASRACQRPHGREPR